MSDESGFCVTHHSLLITHYLAWALVALLAFRLALFSVDAAVRPSNDFIAYYTAARLVKAGADVNRFYDDDWFAARIAENGPPIYDIYSPNPPTMSILLLPVADLEYAGARAVWTLLNLACLAVAISWLLCSRGLAPRAWWAPGFAAFVLLFQPVFANLSQGQSYLMLLALLVVAWHGYRRQRSAVLGIALGLMLVFKTAGVLLWLLLLVRRRGVALAWGVATVLLIGTGSLPWLGLEAWRAWLERLGDLGSQPEMSVTAYQALPGFVQHLLTFDPRWNPAPLFQAPELAGWLVAAVLLGIVGASAYRAWTTDQRDLAFAAFVLASLVVSPVSQDYHYVLALLPVAILLKAVAAERSPWPKLLLGAAIVLLAVDLPYRSPRLAEGAWALLAYPKLYGALLLWGLAVWSSRRSPLPLGEGQGEGRAVGDKPLPYERLPRPRG